jgi:beta-lactamase regulating signal transducer with metallopeptidase domain
MINFLVSSTLCSALLLLGYHLLLKNKTTYQFNRAYLLLSLGFSLVIPFITIKQPVTDLIPAQTVIEQLKIFPVDDAPRDKIVNQTVAARHDINDQPAVEINYTLYIVTGLYGLAALVLLARFIKNVVSINLSAQNSERLPYRDAWLVLITDKLTPHTFLNYIFINRDDYVNNLIESDVLKHELTHARQWHSADVLFIELLQVICWFNPFIFLYRKAIQLNHEFIADAAVINGNHDVSGYQYLLLGKISGLSAPGITSQFNYSVTKKRLIMMTKNTSAGMALSARLSIVPVMALAFVLFCSKTQAQQQPVVKQPATSKVVKAPAIANAGKSKPAPPMIRFSDYPYTKDGVSEDKLKEYMAITAKYEEGPDREIKRPAKVTAEDEQKMEPIFRQMSMAQQDQQSITFFYMPGPLRPSTPTQKQLDEWKDPKYCGVWINDKKSKNSDLENYKPGDFGNFFVSRLLGAARKHVDYKYQVDLMTADYYKSYRAEAIANRHKPHMSFRMLNRHISKI